MIFNFICKNPTTKSKPFSWRNESLHYMISKSPQNTWVYGEWGKTKRGNCDLWRATKHFTRHEMKFDSKYSKLHNYKVCCVCDKWMLLNNILAFLNNSAMNLTKLNFQRSFAIAHKSTGYSKSKTVIFCFGVVYISLKQFLIRNFSMPSMDFCKDKCF